MSRLENRKAVLEKFHIKGKKDWAIFWVLAALVCYGGSSRLSRYQLRYWMFEHANPYMSNLNDPSEGWQRILITILLLAVVGEAVLFLCKKSWKWKVTILSAAVLAPFLILGAYRIHTNLIVSSLWKEEPKSGSVWLETELPSGKNGLYREELTEEEWVELLALCRNLTLVSDEEKVKELEKWYQEADDPFKKSDEIQLGFPQRWGHSYSFHLRLYEGKVFMWRGNGSQPEEYVTFFEDNGITAWLEELVEVRQENAG